MAIRRHLALPKIALAAALGATALATTAAATEHPTPAHSDGTHSANAFPSGYGDSEDWNTMVPDGGPVLS
jgi:Spy/CpxP family protein refolding chaperone